MLKYNLIECSNKYLKTSEGSWQYYIDKSGLNDDDDDIVNLPGNNALY